jgi:signal transduction histidine kinase
MSSLKSSTRRFQQVMGNARAPFLWTVPLLMGLFGITVLVLTHAYQGVRDAAVDTYLGQQQARVSGLAAESATILRRPAMGDLVDSSEGSSEPVQRFPVHQLSGLLTTDRTWIVGPDQVFGAAPRGRVMAISLADADPELQAMVADMRAGQSGSAEFEFRDPGTGESSRQVASFARIQGAPLGWSFAISSHESRALSGVNGALQSLVRAGALVLAAALIICLVALVHVRVTHRQRLSFQAERASMSRAAAHAERLAMVGTMTAGVAHDMRGPLTTLSLLVDLMRMGDVGVDEDLISDMGLSVDRLRELATDLTEFSRCDDEKDVSAVGRADPVRCVRTALRLLGPDYAQRCELALDFSGVSLVGMSDRRLVQVLLNLLINAKKFANHFRISASVDDERMFMCVEDDGPGVEPALRGRVFEAFVTSRVGGEGTGLGLYLCRRFLQECGGSIALTDDGNLSGACFRFQIPLVQAEHRAVPRIEAEDIRTDSAGS